jgi:hypothetical protein
MRGLNHTTQCTAGQRVCHITTNADGMIGRRGTGKERWEQLSNHLLPGWEDRIFRRATTSTSLVCNLQKYRSKCIISQTLLIGRNIRELCFIQVLKNCALTWKQGGRVSIPPNHNAKLRRTVARRANRTWIGVLPGTNCRFFIGSRLAVLNSDAATRCLHKILLQPILYSPLYDASSCI